MDIIEAKRYDQGMYFLERLSLLALRRRLVSEVTGEVLEIGTGTGANLGLYRHEVHVTAIDLRESYLRAAAAKSMDNAGAHELATTCADAQHLPFADDAFDAVVGSLVFCSIREPQLALGEVCRVLRPGGRLHLLEHVRGQNRLTRIMTDLLHPFWYALQGECHLNRETAESVAAAGFELQSTSQHAGGVLQMIKAIAPMPCVQTSSAAR